MHLSFPVLLAIILCCTGRDQGLSMGVLQQYVVLIETYFRGLKSKIRDVGIWHDVVCFFRQTQWFSGF